MTPESQSKDNTHFVDIPDGHDLNSWVNKQNSTDQINESQDRIYHISDYEVAVGLWIFQLQKKNWRIAGIFRQEVYRLLNKKFCYHKRYSKNAMTLLWVRDTNHILEEVPITATHDDLRSLIESTKNFLQVHVGSAKLEATFFARIEKFNRQSHLLINDKSLLNLPTHQIPLLKDNEEKAFFPYQNGIIEVTGETFEILPYSMLLDKCIWKSQVINRHFEPSADYMSSHFAQFARNVTAGEEGWLLALMTGIGYVIHGYNAPSRSQAVLLYDQEITNTKHPQGGTGKGLIIQAIKQLRPTVIIDAKRYDDRQRFSLQGVHEDTQVVAFDDPRHDFFSSLFSALSEGLTIERKNQPEFTFEQSESPKIIIASNIILATEGSSYKRRQFIIELGPFYKRMLVTGIEQPILDYHNCTFFSSDWDEGEWARFDRFMIECVRLYLQYGLCPYATKGVESNRLRQTTGDDFFEWVTQCNGGEGLKNGVTYDSAELFKLFKLEFQIDDNCMRQRGFTERLKKYGLTKRWEFIRRPGNSNSEFSYQSIRE